MFAKDADVHSLNLSKMVKSIFNYSIAMAIVLFFMLGLEFIVTGGMAFEVSSFNFAQWLFSILYWIICLGTGYWAGVTADADHQESLVITNRYRL